MLQTSTAYCEYTVYGGTGEGQIKLKNSPSRAAKVAVIRNYELFTAENKINRRNVQGFLDEVCVRKKNAKFVGNAEQRKMLQIRWIIESYMRGVGHSGRPGLRYK